MLEIWHLWGATYTPTNMTPDDCYAGYEGEVELCKMLKSQKIERFVTNKPWKIMPTA